jgi:hypothetical protein
MSGFTPPDGTMIRDGSMAAAGDADLSLTSGGGGTGAVFCACKKPPSNMTPPARAAK